MGHVRKRSFTRCFCVYTRGDKGSCVGCRSQLSRWSTTTPNVAGTSAWPDFPPSSLPVPRHIPFLMTSSSPTVTWVVVLEARTCRFSSIQQFSSSLRHKSRVCDPVWPIVQELCESRGGRPGLSVLTSLLVSVDVKNYWTVLRHWSQLVPNMSTDIWGH